MLSLLKSLQEQGVITQGDYYFAQLIADKQKDKGYAEPVQNLAILLAALCNWSYTQGNTCCVLDRFLERNLFGLVRILLFQLTHCAVFLRCHRSCRAAPIYILLLHRLFSNQALLLFDFDFL